MDIKAYIESGIIEQFVMGETSGEQAREVMAYARQYPEIQAEIEAVENALIKLSENNSHKPQERTREQLMGKLFNGTPASGEGNPGSAPVMEIPMSKRPLINKQYLVAASVALLASIGLNLFLYGRLKDSENALVALNSEKQQFAAQMASEKNSYNDLQKQMDMINSVDVMQVKLSGMNVMPDAKAMVYYNKADKKVYLHINHLPAAPDDRQYQLWAIVGGKPVDAGVFDAADKEKMLMQMKSSEMPAAFAVTIEKKGGSVNPTMEKMVLLGNVSS